MDKIFMQKVIRETTEYDKFTAFVGQPKERATKNYRKLIDSINKHGGNLVPVLVDNKFNIIDGNTRHYACEQCKKPIRYEVIDATDVENLEMMRILNSTSTKWNIDNFIEFYAKGYEKEEFITFRAFKQDKIAGISVYEAFVDGLSTENIEKGILPDYINYSKVAERFHVFNSIKEACEGRAQETGLARAVMALEREGTVKYPELYRAVKSYWDKALKKQETKKTGAVDSACQALNVVYNYNKKRDTPIYITERTL